MTSRNRFSMSKIPMQPRHNKCITRDVPSRPPRGDGAPRCHERAATTTGGAGFVTSCRQRRSVSQGRKGRTLPRLGADRPRRGMTRPLQGMDHPFPGITRPFLGMTRPLPGMARPLPGGDRLLRGMGHPLRGVGRRRQGGRRRRCGGAGTVARRGRRGYGEPAGFPIIGG